MLPQEPIKNERTTKIIPPVIPVVTVEIQNLSFRNTSDYSQPGFVQLASIRLWLRVYESTPELTERWAFPDKPCLIALRASTKLTARGKPLRVAKLGSGAGGEMTQKMRQKLKRAGYRSRYGLRKQIGEPVFGQIKQVRGFRQFLLRGLEAVQAEWALICTDHNITKLAKAI